MIRHDELAAGGGREAVHAPARGLELVGNDAINPAAPSAQRPRTDYANQLKAMNSSRGKELASLSFRNQQENSMKPYAALVLSLGMAVAPSMLQAQDAWPARPITFLVPYGAGGYTDLVGRLTARYVEKALGKPVIVDTRPGAGGIVGTQAVVNAAADGYMFCVCSIGAISIAPFDPNQKVAYDPVRDLAPVGVVSSIAQAVIVKKDLPVKTMAELVSYAKANPGKLNYGSSGAGGLTHYSVELFQARTGIKVVHIPFKGGAQSTAAVVAGEVDFSFANMTDAMPQVQGGSVRGLAVTSQKRSPYLPDLPTVHEAVLANFVVETWNGIMAPSKTPEPIVRRLSEILIKMADDPEAKEIMRRAGADTVKTTPEEYRAQIAQEIAQWKPLIEEIAQKK
jgi:tripartite-type tricarboxylate transporter receptor subunit TctC